jgi:hypothetical protein
LEGFAKKVSEKYRINKAIHEFNKALIENDYLTNVRNIIYGGRYKSSVAKSGKNLSNFSQGDRPYSANPNLVKSYENPYVNGEENVIQATDFSEEKQTSSKKRRPKTGKTRSMHNEEAKHMSSHNSGPESSESKYNHL